MVMVVYICVWCGVWGCMCVCVRALRGSEAFEQGLHHWAYELQADDV